MEISQGEWLLQIDFAEENSVQSLLPITLLIRTVYLVLINQLEGFDK